MKRLILCAALATCRLGLMAQEPADPMTSQWLAPFTRVEIDAPADVRLIAVPASEAPRIAYDMRGKQSRLRAEVREGVLYVRERGASADDDPTRIEIRYNELTALDLVDARVQLADTLHTTLFDLTLDGRAYLRAALDVDDLAVELTGHSEAALTGRASYLTLFASTGIFDALALDNRSARVNVQGGATVNLRPDERLEAASSTGGTVRYRGTPRILRTKPGFMAGAIRPIE